MTHGINIAPQTDLYLVDQVERTRNYRPGWGGMLQHQDTEGWHELGHCGRVEGSVLAVYSPPHQVRTQTNVGPALANVYSIHYLNLAG